MRRTILANQRSDEQPMRAGVPARSSSSVDQAAACDGRRSVQSKTRLRRLITQPRELRSNPTRYRIPIVTIRRWPSSRAMRANFADLFSAKQLTELGDIMQVIKRHLRSALE